MIEIEVYVDPVGQVRRLGLLRRPTSGPWLKDANRFQLDRHLLYVAWTRAMHALMLIYLGDPSSFLAPSDNGDTNNHGGA